jgi:hypothetical protein
MKLSDLLEDGRTWSDVQQQYSDDPEFLRLVVKAKQLPGIKTWDDAVDKAGRMIQQTPTSTPKPKPQPAAATPQPQPKPTAQPQAKPDLDQFKRGSDDRVLKHQRFYRDDPGWEPTSRIGKAVKGAVKGAVAKVAKGIEFGKRHRGVASKSKFIQR